MMQLLLLYVSLWWIVCGGGGGGGGVVVMAASSSSSSQKGLDNTPTWAVAGVCAVIIVVSIILEKVLHKVGMWFTERRKKALFEALEKVKTELMILGFISLLLTFGQTYFVKICVSVKLAGKMIPCAKTYNNSDSSEDTHERRLLWLDRRSLAAGDSSTNCKEGYEPLISVEGLHQLHILIFFLAFFHVILSSITMLLGRLKIRDWKAWELETSSHEYEFSHDPSRFRLAHETSFVKGHTSFWTKNPFFFYIGCFIRQFSRSVNKVDYLTLRTGFINVHLSPASKFNFQRYIKRSLEDDFKTVVGVSPGLWFSFVIYLLINVKGWQALFWASILPAVIILAVGTKLQAILTKMAMEIAERHALIQGMPVVQLSDGLFWFGRPELFLHLIHFALFQNAFQITYFLWIWYSFGLKSCFHKNFKLSIVKLALGLVVLIICSYITLPLYALVNQMGSRMKKSIFDEQTSKALKKWHLAVKKKHIVGKLPTPGLGESVSPSSSALPSILKLHRFKTTGHSTRYSQEDQDLSDMENDVLSATPTINLLVRADDSSDQLTEIITVISEPSPLREAETSNEDEFTFVKPATVKET